MLTRKGGKIGRIIIKRNENERKMLSVPVNKCKRGVQHRKENTQAGWDMKLPETRDGRMKSHSIETQEQRRERKKDTDERKKRRKKERKKERKAEII